MPERVGKYTIKMSNNINIHSSAGIAGQKESEGPLGKYFDQTFQDNKLGQDSWEKAEISMLERCLDRCLEKAGGALERLLERVRFLGPAVGAAAGAVPQCGVSAAAASLYAGGVITVGTLLAVFLSTSDELIPVLLSARAPAGLLAKIVGIKVVCALGVGFVANGALAAARHIRRQVGAPWTSFAPAWMARHFCGRPHRLDIFPRK